MQVLNTPWGILLGELEVSCEAEICGEGNGANNQGLRK